MPEVVLRVCALYPDLMNIYADRGNLLMLQRRCEWRGIGFELTPAGLGDAVDPAADVLFYLGGGQDRDQALCAQDLVETKRDALHAAADGGGLVLGICGGFQLLGHAYELGDKEIPGLGLVDLRTVRVDSHRLVGNVAIEVALDAPRASWRASRTTSASPISVPPSARWARSCAGTATPASPASRASCATA